MIVSESSFASIRMFIRMGDTAFVEVMPCASVSSARRAARLTTISILASVCAALVGGAKVTTADIGRMSFRGGNRIGEAVPERFRRTGNTAGRRSVLPHRKYRPDRRFLQPGQWPAAVAGSTGATEFARAKVVLWAGASCRT